MTRFILSFVLALVVTAVAVAAVIGDTLYGWTRRPIAAPGDTSTFASVAIEKIKKEANGNVAFVLVDNGAPTARFFGSNGTAVDEATQFQVASLSKWISAFGVMTLVEKGLIDLDAPVATYLSRWSLPASEFNNDGVTVRRLLSHTAGLTDGLGYAGFAPGAPIQSLEESLTKARDASPGRSGKVEVGAEPGAKFLYSGGGFTLLQLIVEEVSGKPFNDYMAEAVFTPLGMSRSTYVLADDATNVAEFFDETGSLATHYRFASLAATSLYTSAKDLTHFVEAHLPGPSGEPAGRGVLRPETLRMMRNPEAREWGADIWGLGTMLYAPNDGDDFIIGHDGNNDPAINTAARFDPATGDGIIVLETGNKLLATEIASEWVFWNVGNVDFLDVTMRTPAMLERSAFAAVSAFVAAFVIGWFSFRRRRR